MDQSYIDSIRRLLEDNIETNQPRTTQPHTTQPSRMRHYPLYEYANVNRQNRTRVGTGQSNVEILHSLLQGYNINMQHYQENFLHLMTVLIREMREGNERRSRRMQQRQAAESRMHFEFIPTNMNTFFQNVVVAPTEEEINNATSIMTYNTEEPLNFTSCPITIDNFEDGEQVAVLNHCGHAFREDALRNWFRTSVRCPVCRHDIRTSTPRNAQTMNAPSSPTTSPLQPNSTPVVSQPTSPREQSYNNITEDSNDDLYGGQPLSRTNSHTTQSIQNIIEQTMNALQAQLPNGAGHIISMDIPVQFDVSFQEQNGDNERREVDSDDDT